MREILPKLVGPARPKSNLMNIKQQKRAVGLGLFVDAILSCIGAL